MRDSGLDQVKSNLAKVLYTPDHEGGKSLVCKKEWVDISGDMKHKIQVEKNLILECQPVML